MESLSLGKDKEERWMWWQLTGGVVRDIGQTSGTDHLDSIGEGLVQSAAFCGRKCWGWQRGICKFQRGVNSKPEKQLKQKQMRIIRRDSSKG